MAASEPGLCPVCGKVHLLGGKTRRCAWPQGPSPADRAIEFARYLAASAERYMACVNSFECAREGDSDETVEEATIAMTEAYSRLASDIYEFRKRIPA